MNQPDPEQQARVIELERLIQERNDLTAELDEALVEIQIQMEAIEEEKGELTREIDGEIEIEEGEIRNYCLRTRQNVEGRWLSFKVSTRKGVDWKQYDYLVGIYPDIADIKTEKLIVTKRVIS